MFTFQTTSPGSGQITAVGWYLVFSLLFVVAAMVEFAVVMIFKHRMDKCQMEDEKPKQKCRPGNIVNVRELATIDNVLGQETHKGHSANKKLPEPNRLPINRKVDEISFIVFPTLFILFNSIYLIYYD